MGKSKLGPSRKFRGGSGISRWYVNCSRNPMDLRPASDTIIQAYKARRNELGPDAKIAIIMGDDHTMPSRMELFRLVASRMHDENLNPSINIEQEHNFLGEIITVLTGKNIPGDLQCDLEDYDCGGFITMCSYGAFFDSDRSPATRKNMAEYFFRNRIPINFNDAARKEGKLDLSDPSTLLALHTVLKESTDHQITKLQSNAIRNAHMAHSASTHASRISTNTVLQSTGQLHVLGGRAGICNYIYFPYKNSLCAKYKECGFDVIPIFLTSRMYDQGINVLPQSSYEDLQSGVIVDGLAENIFLSESFSRSIGGTYVDGAEESFLIRISNNSGGEISFSYSAAIREELKRKSLSSIAAILTQYDNSREYPYFNII